MPQVSGARCGHGNWRGCAFCSCLDALKEGRNGEFRWFALAQGATPIHLSFLLPKPPQCWEHPSMLSTSPVLRAAPVLDVSPLLGASLGDGSILWCWVYLQCWVNPLMLRASSVLRASPSAGCTPCTGCTPGTGSIPWCWMYPLVLGVSLMLCSCPHDPSALCPQAAACSAAAWPRGCPPCLAPTGYQVSTSTATLGATGSILHEPWSSPQTLRLPTGLGTWL